MKKEVLQNLQGLWRSTEDRDLTIEFIGETAKNQDGQIVIIVWRDDISQWIIPGFSIAKLRLVDGMLHLETPKNQIGSGVSTYIKVR